MLGFGKLTAQSVSEKADILRRLGNAETYTRAVLAAMPEADLGYRPEAGARSFAEIFEHIGSAQLYTASQGLKVKKLQFDGSLKAKAALNEFLAASYGELRRAIEALDEDELGKTKSFWDGRASVSRILNFTLDHVTHHRGQATVYLRMRGHSVPDYVGW